MGNESINLLLDKNVNWWKSGNDKNTLLVETGHGNIK